MINIDELKDILTLKQASEVIGCHPNTLRNWTKDGTIDYVRFGKRRDRRFKKEVILSKLKEMDEK